jgi:hypothetical protein
MDKAYSSRTPMIIRALEKDIDIFQPLQDGEEVLDSEYPYLRAIGALMYLANNTRPDIAFAVNLLVRYSVTPTMRHWNGVKDVYDISKIHRIWVFSIRKIRISASLDMPMLDT